MSWLHDAEWNDNLNTKLHPNKFISAPQQIHEYALLEYMLISRIYLVDCTERTHTLLVSRFTFQFASVRCVCVLGVVCELFIHTKSERNKTKKLKFNLNKMHLSH